MQGMSRAQMPRVLIVVPVNNSGMFFLFFSPPRGAVTCRS